MFNRLGFIAKKISSAVVVTWGSITGTLSAQTDLQSALNAKAASFTQFRFSADSDTGFDNPSADTIDIVTGGSVAWKIISGGELNGPNAATSSSNGTTRVIRGGSGGSSSGNGGLLSLIGGSAPTSGIGGGVRIEGDVGIGTNKAGGDVSLVGGASQGSAQGGSIQLVGGAGGSTGIGGAFSLSGGSGGISGGNGGSCSLSGGQAFASGASGGSISVSSGSLASGATTHGNVNLQIAATTIARVNGTTKHLSHLGSTPTITAGGGTSPSIVGKDEVFIVTIGTGGTATSVEVTFANAFSNIPVAIADSDTDIVALKTVETTTKVTISATAPFTAGSKVKCIVRGYE